MQKASSPIPIYLAAIEAVLALFFKAIAQPKVYAQQAFSKAIG